MSQASVLPPPPMAALHSVASVPRREPTRRLGDAMSSRLAPVIHAPDLDLGGDGPHEGVPEVAAGRLGLRVQNRSSGPWKVKPSTSNTAAPADAGSRPVWAKPRRGVGASRRIGQARTIQWSRGQQSCPNGSCRVSASVSIALLTLEAAAASRAVRRFVVQQAARIALVGLSDPYRASAGGAAGQLLRHLRRSGPRILPYLAVNFTVPRLAGLVRRPAADDAEASPLPVTCRRLGIPSLVVADVNGQAFVDALARSGADLLVTFHFDQILSAATIAVPRLGGINVHAGLLPHHRGPVPTIHALLDDPVRLGVTVHRLVPRIDAGAVLAQAPLPDEPGLSALSAASRLHQAALPLLDRILADLEAGRDAAAERPLPILPYRGFPTSAELGRLARQGRSPAGWSDLRDAWRLPVRDRA